MKAGACAKVLGHQLGSDRAVPAIDHADPHFPETRVLATGSSTLGASARFRDTLAGRKADVFLTPMVLRDLAAFERPHLDHRMLRGGLPPFFLAPTLPEPDFQERMDAYWAKDILELFRLERRAAFQRLFELILVRSGGIFDASRFARDCGVSRTTIANYLAVLEATSVAHAVRVDSYIRDRRRLGGSGHEFRLVGRQRP